MQWSEVKRDADAAANLVGGQCFVKAAELWQGQYYYCHCQYFQAPHGPFFGLFRLLDLRRCPLDAVPSDVSAEFTSKRRPKQENVIVSLDHLEQQTQRPKAYVGQNYVS